MTRAGAKTTRTRVVSASALGALSVVSFAIGLGGCVSLKRTPASRYFVLDALVEPAPAAAVAPAPADAAGPVGVVPVRLPGHLLRPQLVVQLDGNEVRVDEFARWAEPLDAGVTRVLADNLANLLPGRRVVRYPWPASAGLRCRVSVTLSALSQRSDGQVRLEGRFALLPARDEQPLVQRNVALGRGPLPAGPAGADPGPAVQALSELLADLSRQIAEAVRALPAETQGSTSGGS